MTNYTSQALSKAIADSPFDGESEMKWCGGRELTDTLVPSYTLRSKSLREEGDWSLPAYDILNDLCVRYAKEVFGEDMLCQGCGAHMVHVYCVCGAKTEVKSYLYRSQFVFALLQQGKKEEAEAYFMEHSILFK